METMLQNMTKTRQNQRMRKRYWLMTFGARTHIPCSSSIPGIDRLVMSRVIRLRTYIYLNLRPLSSGIWIKKCQEVVKRYLKHPSVLLHKPPF